MLIDQCLLMAHFQTAQSTQLPGEQSSCEDQLKLYKTFVLNLWCQVFVCHASPLSRSLLSKCVQHGLSWHNCRAACGWEMGDSCLFPQHAAPSSTKKKLSRPGWLLGNFWRAGERSGYHEDSTTFSAPRLNSLSAWPRTRELARPSDICVTLLVIQEPRGFAIFRWLLNNNQKKRTLGVSIYHIHSYSIKRQFRSFSPKEMHYHVCSEMPKFTL